MYIAVRLSMSSSPLLWLIGKENHAKQGLIQPSTSTTGGLGQLPMVVGSAVIGPRLARG